MNENSPFEEWRLKDMQGMAASSGVMELLALAFEGGRQAERQAIGEDIMAFYRILVQRGDPARTKVEHCLSLIRLRAK